MNSESPSASPSRLPKGAAAFALLVALAILVARLPFRGVRHDAILYLGQALAHLNPAWASADYYFAAGSQDRYSVFSPLLAWLVTHAGIGPAEITLLLVAWAGFLAALVLLSRELPYRARWFGVVAVIAASHFYGAQRVFSFLEPFLTARTWAEPLSLLALAALTFRHRLVAIVCIAAAMAFHPLIALPAVAVGFAWLVGEDRRWAWLLAGLVPVPVLAVLHVAPFDGLLQVYDPAWLDITMRANGRVFMTTWRLEDVLPVAVGASLLVAYVRHHPGTALARLCRATLVTVPALCAVSFVGADLLHDVLVTQLQLWRVLWLLDVLALLVLPVVLADEWRKGPNGQLAAVAVLVAVFTVDTWLGTGWVMVAWAVLALFVSARGVVLKPSVSRLAMIGTWCVGLMMSGLQAVNVLGQIQMHRQGTAVADASSIPFTLPLLTLPLALVLLIGWERGRAARVASVLVASALLLLSGLHWDQRSDWARYIEGSRQGEHPFAALIPAGAQVYWYQDVLADWVLLGRPSFMSTNQVSGVLFNRATAMAAIAREPLLETLHDRDENCSAMEWFGARTADVADCRVPVDVLVQACRNVPVRADYIVAPVDLGAGVIARWRFAPPDGRDAVTYSLHDCKALR